MQIIGKYGLKCKREVWRVGMTLAHLRKAAREHLTLDEKDPRRLFEGAALMKRMYNILILGTSMGFWTKPKINWIMFWDWPYTDSWTGDYKPWSTERGWPDPSTTPESSSDKDISEWERIWPTCHPAWWEWTLRRTSTSPRRVRWEGADQEETKGGRWRGTTTRRPKKNDL